MLSSTNVHNLDSVELETYRSAATGGLFQMTREIGGNTDYVSRSSFRPRAA